MNRDIDIRLKNLIINLSRNNLYFEDISDNSELVNDFGYDSIMLIKLVVNIENEFNIKFDDELLTISILDNYSYLRKYIEQKIQ